MTERPQPRLLFLTIILGLLATLGPIGQDMFIPSIPKIAADLGTTTNIVIFSVSSVLFGNAIGQIFHGPLADRFGRKPVIIGVLILFTASSGAALWATTIELLIVLRFFQGLALSGGRILAAAIARDYFEKERLGKLMSDIMFVTAIGTVIAPMSGGLIAQHLPWQISMGVMASFGIIVLGLFLFGYQESGGAPDRTSLNPAILAATMKKVLTNRTFLMNTLCSTFMLSGFIIFLSLSASVLIEGFGMRGDFYGFLFAGVSSSFLAGTFVSGRLVAHLKLHQMVGLGIVIGSAGGLTMAGLALAGMKLPAAVIIPMAIFVFGLALVIPHATAAALTPLSDSAGTASSVSGFLQSMTSAGISFALTLFTHDDAVIMGIAISVVALIALLIYVAGVRRRPPAALA
ncbi:MAG: hypothetical protein CBD27_04145 [Rhodospirillaceae bacterium TMED167]|nr:hypothetical protein [Rhodospirillaceae bacterium]OUW28715.1 MAG: hypothetical protein CBD27_04145 [Rhodospirillaceae bacterium TMED167]